RDVGDVWIRAADAAELRHSPPPYDLLQTDHIERGAVEDLSERTAAQPDLTEEEGVEREHPEPRSHDPQSCLDGDRQPDQAVTDASRRPGTAGSAVREA